MQYFFVVAVTIAGKSARDTFFLSRYEKSYLPLMFVACAAVVALIASAYSRATGKMGRAALASGSYGLFIVVLLALDFRLKGFAIPALYVWVEVVISIVTLQFWTQAAEIFDARQAKRLFALIGAGGSLAAFATGMSLKPFVRAFGANSLLLFVCGGLAASWLLGLLASRYILRAAPHPKRTAGTGDKPKLDRYLTLMALIVALSAMVTQVVDYQFKITASQTISNEADLASFFGRFYAATGVASLLMQLFFSAAILNVIGIRGSLLTLPAALGASAASFLVSPGLAVAAAAKFCDQTFKFTLNNSSLELLWLPVSAERRRALRPVVGGTMKASAEALVGVMMFFLLKRLDIQYLSLLSLTAVAGWIALCIAISGLYVIELAKAIERRQVDFADLEVDVQDPSFNRTIALELQNPDPFRRLFALELIEGMPLGPWAERLRQMLHSGTPEERDRVMALALHDTETLPDSLLIELLEQPGDLAKRAIQAAAARSLSSSLPHLRSRLQDSDELTRAQAAAAILKVGGPGDWEAKSVLAGLAKDGRGEAQSIAVRQLAHDVDTLPESTLRSVLATGSPEAIAAAAEVAALRADTAVVPTLLAHLSDRKSAEAALQSLPSFPAQAVREGVISVLRRDPPVPHRAGVLRAMQDLPIENATGELTRVLHRLDRTEMRAAAAAMVKLKQQDEVPVSVLGNVDGSIVRLSRESYQCVRLLTLLPEGPEGVLLRDYFETRVREAVPALMLFGSISGSGAPVEQCVRLYESGDNSRLPFVLEYIDSSFPKETKTRILPLLEQTPWGEKDEAGIRLHSDLPFDFDAAVREMCESKDSWESVIARHYRMKAYPGSVVDLESGMYSTLEKTILLKSVSLFQGIPAEKLSRVAAIAEEKSVPEGTVILREGEFGESLFVVAGGSVRIHIEDRELTVFRRGDCLGEMSLLDGAPRSASATAMEETTLLEIDQPSFYQVMEAYPEIMKEIVRLLTRRLREANDRIAAAGK
jgi:ATP/ADP translocase